MARLFSNGNLLATGEPSGSASAENLLLAIEAFLSSCRSPAALEWGENAIPLLADQYALQIQSGRLTIEIWNENRSISRRILALQRRASGILDCAIHRFGGKPGRLSFLDLDRPQTAHRSLTGSRQNFAEQFRTMAARQFPGWAIECLTVSQDLRRSFSGVYPRARLTQGRHTVAAIACSNPLEELQFLTFALIWHHALQARAEPGHMVSLALFLPERSGNVTAHRLRWLNQQRLQPVVYLYNQHGAAGQVDPHDLGNLDTRVASQFARGTDFASAHAPHLVADGPPEHWLESVVRANITKIDAELMPFPVHRQVLTFAAEDRDLIDLLAASPGGRLCVLELKASEDLHLPIQALDYWMRVAWHTQRGELNHLFPTIAVQALPPKLILLAPAMDFHSTCADILSYFAPEIEVERVGVNSDWRNELRVILRLAGASRPVSQR